MAYGYYRSETVQTGQVPSTQTDFPALFSRTHNDFRTVGNGGHVENASGYDLNLFEDSGGAPGSMLDMETEAYDAATGAVRKWARVPSIDDGQKVWWQYGDSGISSSQDSAPDVWNSGYVAVYHMGDGSTLSVADSTANGLNLTNNGTVAAGAGQVGGSAFTANTNYLSHTGHAAFNTSDYTVEAWYKRNGAPSNGVSASIVSHSPAVGNAGHYYFFANDTTGKLQLDAPFVAAILTGNAVLSTATWYRIAASKGSTAYTITIDGAQDATITDGSSPSATGAFQIGAYDSVNLNHAYYDEVRISNIARSADWLEADYNNQFAPTSFWGLGAEQTAGGDAHASLIGGDLFHGRLLFGGRLVQ